MASFLLYILPLKSQPRDSRQNRATNHSRWLLHVCSVRLFARRNKINISCGPKHAGRNEHQ